MDTLSLPTARCAVLDRAEGSAAVRAVRKVQELVVQDRVVEDKAGAADDAAAKVVRRLADRQMASANSLSRSSLRATRISMPLH